MRNIDPEYQPSYSAGVIPDPNRESCGLTEDTLDAKCEIQTTEMNINEHPIYTAIYDLCREIEKLPASEQQTKVVTMAGDLEKPVRNLVAECNASKQQSTETKDKYSQLASLIAKHGVIRFAGTPHINYCPICGLVNADSGHRRGCLISKTIPLADTTYGLLNDALKLLNEGTNHVCECEPSAGLTCFACQCSALETRIKEALLALKT